MKINLSRHVVLTGTDNKTRFISAGEQVVDDATLAAIQAVAPNVPRLKITYPEGGGPEGATPPATVPVAPSPDPTQPPAPTGKGTK